MTTTHLNVVKIDETSAYVAIVEMTPELAVFTDALLESGAAVDSNWLVEAYGEKHVVEDPKIWLAVHGGRAYRRNVYTGGMTHELVQLAKSLGLPIFIQPDIWNLLPE